MTTISDIHVFNGTFEFRNIGRAKACFTKKLKTEEDFWEAIEPHVLSQDLEYQYDPVSFEGKLFAGGFRHIGDFVRVGA